MAKKKIAKSHEVSERPESIAADLRVTASPVAAVARLTHILMDDSHAKRTVEGYTDPDTVRLKMGVHDAEVGNSEQSDKFFVRLGFTLKLENKEADSAERPVVEIMARFVILYDLPEKEGITHENLIAFAQTSGVFSIWPYWREFVHSMSMRMGVPSIVLPTRRI